MSTRSATARPGSRVGDRIGVPWLGRTDGTCRFCRRGQENLCLRADVHRLGRATAATPTPAWSTRRYAYRLPDALDDEQAAPLLCAGIIGYRALRLRRGAAGRPARHLRLRRQRAPDRADRAAPGAARARADPRRGQPPAGRPSSAPTRSATPADEPPEPLDGAILFAPAGELVPVALRALDRGGTLAVAGIWLSDVPASELRRRAVRGAAPAQRHGEHPRGRRGVPARWRTGSASARRRSPTRSRSADAALADLARGRFSGAAVLHMT